MTSFLFVVKIPVHEDERPSKSASEEKSDDDSSEKETKNEDDKSNEKLDVTDDEEHADLDSDNLTKTEKVKEDELKEQKPKVEETQDDDDWDFGDEDTNKELGDTTGAQGKTSDNEDVTQKQEKDKILCENEGGKAESTNKADPGQSSNGNETLDQNKTVTEENTTQNVSFADVLKAAISRENNNEEKDSEQIPLNPEQQCEATVQNNTDISAAEAVGSNDSKTENNNIEKEKELLEEKSVEPHENGDVNKGEGGEDGEQSTAPPKKKFQVEKAAEDSLQLDEALSRQNQIEDTVKHLEKSESVPPLRLHEKLPVPASLSDDRLSEVENVNFQTVSFLDEEPLVETVKAIVESFSIDNFSVQKTENGEFYQVIFLDEGGERCESILNQLAKQKIGDRPGTS
ncbi:dentin sialophosphoprotein-like, partial [Saccostrea cucullata]|uniref:dentin sialophosphoprotein-like n=1 Tax=Saccostrea cuccullata TaxID=36930 RepID=UPI002ED17EF7